MTWTPVYFIAQLFYFIALVRIALLKTTEKLQMHSTRTWHFST